MARSAADEFPDWIADKIAACIWWGGRTTLRKASENSISAAVIVWSVPSTSKTECASAPRTETRDLAIVNAEEASSPLRAR